MSDKRWEAWQIEQPPSGFAERTVAAAIRERGRHQARPARVVILSALAAVLIAGAALGSLARSRGPRETPQSRPSATDAPPGTKSEVPPVPVASEPNSIRPPERPLDLPARAAKPAPHASSAHDAGNPVILPRCSCEPHQIMCTCF
jgi:hypothetical protein